MEPLTSDNQELVQEPLGVVELPQQPLGVIEPVSQMTETTAVEKSDSSEAEKDAEEDNGEEVVDLSHLYDLVVDLKDGFEEKLSSLKDASAASGEVSVTAQLEGVDKVTAKLDQLIGALNGAVVSIAEAQANAVIPVEHQTTEIMKTLKETKAEVDLSPVVSSLAEVEEAVRAIEFPEAVPTDLAPVTSAIQSAVTSLTTAINAAKFSLPTQLFVKIRDENGATVNPASEETLSSIDGKLPALEGGRVPVSLDGESITLTTGDIEIGAVEIKNAATDDRVAVINSAPTTEYGMVVRNIPSGTQPISAASLPLPSGAATSALQTTGNGHLSTLAGTVTAGGSVNTLLSVLNDSDAEMPLRGTSEGHLEVAIHAPRLPFGSIDVAEMIPEVQADAIYGINSTLVRTTTAGSGTATATANQFVVSNNGTTAGNTGSIQSRRRLRYRPGQGSVGRFTAIFTSGVTGCTQVAGLGTAEAGFYFGYDGATFGILHSTGGVREIQTLTVTTASTATNDYVVTLGGTAFNVTATNNGSTTKTAYEISQGTFTGWTAVQRGATVIFLANTAGDKTGTFSLAQTGAGTPAAGSFVETLAGVSTTDTWYPQTSWNGDKLDGTGASGVTLDPTKGNVYQIDYQYLGFGVVTFKVETALNGNNPDFVVVNSLSFPNTRTTVHTSQPSFPFTMAAANTGTASGTATVKCGSFAGFIAGTKKLVGPRFSYYGTATSSTSAYVPLFTVRNDLTYASRANQAVVNLVSVSGAAKSTNGLTTFYLFKNATLTGTPSFSQYSTTSPTYWDTASTGCSITTNDQQLFSGSIATDGNFLFPFSDEITIQPGETITLAVRSVTGTATCVGQLNTREDQ